MPVLHVRTGCNVGGGHGAHRGKERVPAVPVRLRPRRTYHFRLTRELNGPPRETSRYTGREPVSSRRPSQVPHTGGAKIKEGDEYHQALLRWLEADAPAGRARPSRCRVSMEVFPPARFLDGKGEKQRIVVPREVQRRHRTAT